MILSDLHGHLYLSVLACNLHRSKFWISLSATHFRNWTQEFLYVCAQNQNRRFCFSWRCSGDNFSSSCCALILWAWATIRARGLAWAFFNLLGVLSTTISQTRAVCFITVENARPISVWGSRFTINVVTIHVKINTLTHFVHTSLTPTGTFSKTGTRINAWLLFRWHLRNIVLRQSNKC